MVLKGDIPNSATEKGDFNYANEMVQFIKENYANIDIIVAAYPEKHPHSTRHPYQPQAIPFCRV